MRRIPEPELMDAPAQARAYAQADFEVPHSRGIELLQQRLGGLAEGGRALDLGCGPGDVTLRFVRAFPGWEIDAVDGSAPMIEIARETLAHDPAGERVRFECARLPGGPVPSADYDLLLSTSLLHHLADPAVLWSEILQHAGSGAHVFVMDLSRPADPDELETMVLFHCGSEPEVLQRDFRNSLAAAYRPEEVRTQLDAAGLGSLVVETVSDRHWIVWGKLPDRREGALLSSA